jgi:hypothetical protein
MDKGTGDRYSKNIKDKRACALYSLIETAKENGHNPYTYLNSVFTKRLI